jgi:hypothetical protein
MDNCVLDELGVVASRLGSQPINVAPLDDLDVHSLYTVTLNGTRQRMVGAGNSVYANGAEILGSIPGSEDIAFGSHLGQIFFTRSTTKKKYDGSDVTNWGLAMTGSAPTAAAAGDDSKVFASFNSTESPAFVENVGDGISFVAGFDGTANGALKAIADTPLAYSQITKTFAAATNFTVYDSGAIGADSDIIEFYAYVPPEQLTAFTQFFMQVDINGTTPFVSDYYFKIINNEPDENGNDQIVAGWNLFQSARSSWIRIGTNNACSWSTVKAVRAVSGGTTAANYVYFDRWRIRGGTGSPVTGTVRYKYIYVNDTGTYVIKSAPSDVSADLIVSANATAVSIPADSSRDTQADEIWLFRQGGGLDTFYRVATTELPAGFSYTCHDELALITSTFPTYDPMPQAVITYEDERSIASALSAAFATLVASLTARNTTTADSIVDSISITDQMSDADALILNITLNDTIDVPPDDIIAIEGPYFDRMYVLTATDLYPSQALGPDMFSVDEVIHIADETETALWLKKAFDGLYIGTTKDIYRLSGTGNPLEDGTLDLTLQPLNIDAPPISAAIASDNTFLVYVASDGWRAVAGQSGSSRLVGPTSLLYRGLTRHGVEPVNLAGRLRATIAHGQLVAITPEGDADDDSVVLYRHVLGTQGQTWYRHVYPSSWRSIAREPDGTLIAGDTAGFVWTLDDTGRLDGEDGIDLELLTIADDLDLPLQQKTLNDARIVAQTGGEAATVLAYLNDSSDADASFTGFTETMSPFVGSLARLPAVWRVQLRITLTAGAFGAFFSGYDIGAVMSPLGRLTYDSGPMDLGQEFTWVRELRVSLTAVGADIAAVLSFDGLERAAVTIPIPSFGPRTVTIPVPRDFKGSCPRLVMTSTEPFYPEWIDVVRRVSGTAMSAKPIRINTKVAAA